jgi:hypothetical protein
MTTNAIDPVKVLAGVLLAADVHMAAEGDRVFCEQAFSAVLAGIRAHTEQGAEIRAGLGWYCRNSPVRAKTYVPRWMPSPSVRASLGDMVGDNPRAFVVPIHI